MNPPLNQVKGFSPIVGGSEHRGHLKVVRFLRKGMASKGVIGALRWTLRLALGGAFLTAGALKAADPAQFALAVGHYRLAPEAMINLIAILLPWIEIAVGLLVLADAWRQAALNIIIGLTALFLFAIISALARGLNIECGCFGTMGGRHVGLVNLAIDLILLAAAVLLSTKLKPAASQTHFSNAGSQDAAPPI